MTIILNPSLFTYYQKLIMSTETVVSTQGMCSVSCDSVVTTRTPAQQARHDRRKLRRIELRSRQAELERGPTKTCKTCLQVGRKTPVTILVTEVQCATCSTKHNLEVRNKTICALCNRNRHKCWVFRRTKNPLIPWYERLLEKDTH